MWRCDRYRHTVLPLFNSLLCKSLYLHSVSLIASYTILVSSICQSFYSNWAISPPFLIELHQFSLFFSRLSLFYCFGSMRYLICFPSSLFNSIGQLYLSLCSLALLCLFPAFITSHLHSNYKHWIGKQLAVSFVTANVLWMSQNPRSEWNRPV